MIARRASTGRSPWPPRDINYVNFTRQSKIDDPLVVPGEQGTIAHAQLVFGNGMLMLGSARDDEFGKLVRPPADRHSAGTQILYLVVADADRHHAQAVAAGAEVLLPPRDEDYGGRGYM